MGTSVLRRIIQAHTALVTHTGRSSASQSGRSGYVRLAIGNTLPTPRKGEKRLTPTLAATNRARSQSREIRYLPLARRPDYCARSEEHSVDTRYDQVFPPGCHEAHMVGRDANQVRFRQQQRQMAAGRPSVVGAQRDSATKAAWPGWGNNAPTNVDVVVPALA